MLLNIIGVAIIDALASLAASQFVVFGLAQEHVDSGLGGPWLILTAVSILLSVNSLLNKRQSWR